MKWTESSLRFGLFISLLFDQKYLKIHLPDKYYNEGAQRISIRNLIFHEVIGNLLIHREYTNPYPAKFIIEEDRVFTENANRPRTAGEIDPENFSPYPKNPVIVSFFKEIGRADELGSGVRNTFKYCGADTPGTSPEFLDGDIFKTIISLEPTKDEQNGGEGWEEGDEKHPTSFDFEQKHELVLKYCLYEPRSRAEIMEKIKLSHRPHFVKRYLNPMIDEKLLEMAIPEKPKSTNQKYRTTDRGRAIINNQE